MRKFLAGRILEVPLIVLQYYKKPSFSIYIYISIKALYREIKIYKFNCENLLKFSARASQKLNLQI